MKVLAITSCPSGVAHTYMAQEALENTFTKAGHIIKVETQGLIGVENEITAEDLVDTDYVILMKGMSLKGEDRFKGITTIRVTAGDAIKKTEQILAKLEEHYSKNRKN